MKKQALEVICSGIKVWDEWKDNYKKYVPLFITEASKGLSWQAWDQEVFNEYFMRSLRQCISSLRQGYFTNDEKENIKMHWDEIAPVLQKIALNQEQPQFEVYSELKTIIRKYTKSDRRSATYRLIAGLQPQLLCTIVNDRRLGQLVELLQTHATDFKFEWKATWFENSYQMLQLFKQATGIKDGYQVMTLPWQVYKEYDFAKSNHDKTNDMSENKVDEVSALLLYKKQIILQGPPGTGKTRLAKEIAQTLTSANTAVPLTKEAIMSLCAHPVKIPTAKTNLNFTILGINTSGVRVENSEGNEYTAPFNEIFKMFENETWKQEGVIVNGTQSYSAAVARYIQSKWNADSLTEGKGYYKVIQFHPSYSYEDFIRGIVAKPSPDAEGIVYEAENKILVQFAKEALDNYNSVQLASATDMPAEELTKKNLDRFITHIIEAIDKNGKYQISDNVYIFYVDDNRFKYKGDNWETHPNGLNMNFSELEKIIAASISERADIVNLHSLNALSRSHATYYANVVERYNLFLSANTMPVTASIQPKNYVLIIDEINRANLSSVLGELIYALEYRGKEVAAMYEVNGSNKLVLPPNLYIIGTMNTADRSVGHIDYAIRRRFAFVDIVPQELHDNEEIYFNTEGYNKVARLFDKNVSSEFDANDVQIGHSYFIAKKKEETQETKTEIFRLKMDYEVVPILNEYVKDGVLVGKIDEMDVKDYINMLKSGV